ncbi:MAG TPA: hypothetical protein VFI29_18845 [Hanamia sp.]|nr:hypothetical protein [Hanamia sp.]
MGIKKSCFLIIAFCCLGTILKAQGVIKGFEAGEIINIAQAYQQAPNLSFDLDFTYADSASADSIIEELHGSFKISNGRYYSIIDSTELVQGSKYNIAVFYYDSVITISSPHQYSNLLQLPFLDSLFLKANIDSMAVIQLNDSTRRLQMYFDSTSKFSSYTVDYDQNSYLMDSVIYRTKGPYYDPNDPGGDPFEVFVPANVASVIIIKFSNYSYQVIDNSYFMENKYIYTQNGQFFVQPQYSGFQLMVNTSN